MGAQTIQKLRQPALMADSQTLYDLWVNNMAVTAKDIKQAFNVSESTAFKVVNFMYEYAAHKGVKIYAPPTRKLVPTDLLFEAYGWDVRKLQGKIKALQKLGSVSS